MPLRRNDPRRAARCYLGDCLAVLPTLPAASVDAVVTDPPAGISFMGSGWDTFPLRDRGPLPGGHSPQQTPHRHGRGFANGMTYDKTAKAREAFIAFLAEAMKECLRVLKPGGYALVWALPRTSHWTGTAIEDAGFEVRGKIYHLFGSGFPKAKSCLKPAAEEWILARKPGPRVLPLNIEESRISTADNLNGGAYARNGKPRHDGTENWRFKREGDAGEYVPPAGRWPANVCLSHVSLLVLTLKDHLPSDITELIRRYYDDYVRVRELRQGTRPTAVADSLRPAVLHSGVQERLRQDAADARAGGGCLSPVWGDVFGATVVGKGGSPQVLQPDLPQPTPEDANGRIGPSLRQETPARVAEHDVRQQDGGGATAGEPSGLEGGPLQDRRVRQRHDRPFARRATRTGKGDVPQEDLHHGAPSGESGGDGEAAREQGTCPPRQRHQDGQPPGEFDPGNRGRPLPQAPGGSQGGGSFAGGERPLEVLACDVPGGWLCYFEPTGEDLGCRQVGVKRVKGSNVPGPGRTDGPKPGSIYGVMGDSATFHYGDADGMETVEVWECYPDCPVALLDAQAGERGGGYGVRGRHLHGSSYGADGSLERPDHVGLEVGYGDSGGPSRFFYCSKASKSDRGADNRHPTVKSQSLMRWLVGLVSFPGETVLDPFMGSGTTGVACIQTGRKFIGVELNSEYHAIATRRIAQAETEGLANGTSTRE
jgi:DNA modification methylase